MHAAGSGRRRRGTPSPSMQQGEVRQRQQQQKAGNSPSMANEPAKLTHVLWASSKASPSSTSTRMMSAIHSFTLPKVPCWSDDLFGYNACSDNACKQGSECDAKLAARSEIMTRTI